MSGESDFEIVNRGGTVQGETGGVAAAHQIEQDRREAALDDVSAHAPQDGALVPARAGQRIDYGAKAVGGEEVRQGIEKSGDAGAGLVGGGEIGDLYFAAAFRQADGLEVGEVQRLLGVAAHGRTPGNPGTDGAGSESSGRLRRTVMPVSSVPRQAVHWRTLRRASAV